MKANYKYNDESFETKEELLEAHDNIHCIGHEPMIEKETVKQDQGSYITVEEEKTVIDPETKEETTETIEVQKWEPKLVDVAIDVKVGNTFIYVDMTQEHINENRKLDLKKEKSEIMKWYRSRDYYRNKVMYGEWEADDPRILAAKEERPAKQARLDAINAELDQIQ